jgi:DNA replication licensing factor MCM7
LTHAIGQISIDEDDLSDEYDFMDEDDEAHEQRQRRKAASKEPIHKYADMMQKLADRSLDEVLIELDDIVTASLFLHPAHSGLFC